jgi:ABC-2 type transport system ATP-binding protein
MNILIDKEENIIDLKGLTKRYGRLLALDNVTFNVKKGEIFGYIGPNGAGKTTTIKIIIDLIKKTSGESYINGYPIPEKKDVVHKFIGYLPQQVAFQSWRTVNHALQTFGKLSGMDKNNIENRIKELLGLFNLSEIKNKKLSKLSGGMIQKIGLIQAMLHEPELLILDEPLSGLDPDGRYQIKKIIKQMGKNRTTIFFSSHILSDVEDIATRIGILNYGHIVDIGSLEQLKNKYREKNEVDIVLSINSGKWNLIEKISNVIRVDQKSENHLCVSLEKNADIDNIIHQIIQILIKNHNRIRRITPVSLNLDELFQKIIVRDIRT